jgi:NAD(P)-dependent dehydrogenase (short-subunit alcohol dehydrogenase family)
MESASRGVVISGASTGIGRAAALELDKRGYRVFAGVRREQDASALRAEGSHRLTPLMLDVTNAASLTAAAEHVQAALGGATARLVGLVNNAGISVSGPLEFLPLDALRQQLEVNVIGAVAMVQQFAPLLRRSRGRVINVSSVGGFVSTPFQGPYCASKYALEALSDSLRRELRPWGIEVILLQPGSIDTPIWEKGKAEARRALERWPERAHVLYGEAAERAMRAIEKVAERAVPTEVVVAKLCAALETKRPRTRYLAGMDALVLRTASWALPDRALDWFLRTAMKSEA